MEKHQPKTLNLTVIIMVITGLAFAPSMDATNSSGHPFNGDDKGNDSERVKAAEFVLSINISENTLYRDKDISSVRPSLGAPSRTSAFDTRHPLLPVSREQDDVHHEINKSNQVNTNSHNRPAPHSHSHGRGAGGNAESSEMPTSPASSAYFERVELQESQMPARNDRLLLHRHKRYLLFPEGSSFQLVFDLIIPIVDYTNFAIMGITCAVAWELPSKPPSEIIENFRNKLNDGTFGLIRRNDSVHQQLQFITGQGNAESVATAGADKEGGNRQQLSATVATTSAQHTFISNARETPPRNFYYSNTLEESQLANQPTPGHLHQQQPEDDNFLRPLDKSRRKTLYAGVNSWPMHPNKWSSQNSHQTKTSASASPWAKDDWWDRNKDRIQEQWYQNQKKWQTYGTNQRTARNRKILTKQPKHRIYPVFGRRRKRSNPTQLPHHTQLDKDNDDGDGDGVGVGDGDLANKLHVIHTKEHLLTRHKLYGKIEKLYKTRGHNGTACVLRTLCETHKEHRKHGQRHSQRTPRTFVMELLRAIFTLPQDTLATLKLSPSTPSYIDSHYTDAVLRAHQVPTCSRRYDGCERPIWDGVES